MAYYEARTHMNYAFREDGSLIENHDEVMASFRAEDDEAAVRAFSIHGFWEYSIYDESGNLIYKSSQNETSGKLKNYHPWLEWQEKNKDISNTSFDEKGYPSFYNEYKNEIAIALHSVSFIPVKLRREYDLLVFNRTYPNHLDNKEAQRFKFLEEEYGRDAKTNAFVRHCRDYSKYFGNVGYQGYSS